MANRMNASSELTRSGLAPMRGRTPADLRKVWVAEREVESGAVVVEAPLPGVFTPR